jgi:hypothetical protein
VNEDQKEGHPDYSKQTTFKDELMNEELLLTEAINTDDMLFGSDLD